MGNEKLLLVDSEKSIREVTLKVLKEYSISAVNSSEIALQRLNEESFDLVLINLPFKEMYSLFSVIKESHRDIPCLLLISPQEVERGNEFLKTGIYGFILKPFTRQEMLSTVEESLWRSRIIQENVRLKLLMPLFEMTQNLAERPQLEEIFQQIFTLISRETGADLVSFSFGEKGYSVPIFQEIKTTQAGYRDELSGLVRWLENRFSNLQKTLLIAESDEAYPDVLNQLNGFHFASLMVYPLNSKYDTRGILICAKSSAKNSLLARDKELFAIIGHQLSIILENYGLIEELENAHFESLKALASAIEAKDAYTSGHCDRLVDYSALLADKMNMNPDDRKQLRYGAALHDIGKIGIKDAILGKPGKLTPFEYEEMKLHPRIGADILRKIKFLKPVAPIIYHHQECFDGSGYPEGISGEKIPMASRIVAILDTYDAMTTDRPYRKALPAQTAINELLRFSGRQFDPELVKLFIEVLQDKV
jgi:response regulator RpfG family c-di-GMP phosphodiesterase